MKQQYFEVCIGDDIKMSASLYWMCIRGVRVPSIQEAEQFLANDIAKIGGHVLIVSPIDRKTAESCYDFSYEDQWPVFGLAAE